MAGIDRNTGKAISDEESTEQGIGTILTTPIGSRIMRHDVGFEVLDEDGDPKAGLTPDEVETAARKALEAWVPNAIVETIGLEYDGDALTAIHVRYHEKAGGPSRVKTIRYE